jgi:hypothetical protein
MGRVQRWLRERAVLLGLGGATVAIVSALAIGGARSRKSADEDGPAVIERATVVRTADGSARMLLVESVEHRDETSDWNAYRLSIRTATRWRSTRGRSSRSGRRGRRSIGS